MPRPKPLRLTIRLSRQGKIPARKRSVARDEIFVDQSPRSERYVAHEVLDGSALFGCVAVALGYWSDRQDRSRDIIAAVPFDLLLVGFKNEMTGGGEGKIPRFNMSFMFLQNAEEGWEVLRPPLSVPVLSDLADMVKETLDHLIDRGDVGHVTKLRLAG